MRARKPGRHSDEAMGPRALAAMADAARRSREAGLGTAPGGATTDGQPVVPHAVEVVHADDIVTEPELPEPDVRATPTARSMAARDTPAADWSPPPPPDPSIPAKPPFGTAETAAAGTAAARTAAAETAAARTAAAETAAAESGWTARTTTPSGTRPRRERTATRGDHHRRSSKLIVGVSLMAIVAALLGTWAVKDSGGGSLSSSGRPPTTSPHTTPDAPPTAQAGNEGVGAGGTASGAASVTTTTPPAVSTTTTPASAPAAGTGPVLSSIEPASGTPGQTIVVLGSNLMSPSGQITAQFGPETSTVACLAQTSCLVIVPPDGSLTSTTPLTITTDGGTSNALTFTYS